MCANGLVTVGVVLTLAYPLYAKCVIFMMYVYSPQPSSIVCGISICLKIGFLFLQAMDWVFGNLAAGTEDSLATDIRNINNELVSLLYLLSLNFY